MTRVIQINPAWRTCGAWRLAVTGLLLASQACAQAGPATPGSAPATNPLPLADATAGPEAEAPRPDPAEGEANPPPAAPAIFYNLPQAVLVEPSGLHASPNRSEWVAQVEIPAGSTVYVMGRNANLSHLRVVWNTGVGWVPTSFTSYNAQRALLDALPVFEHEPPACAVPITTQFNLNSRWTHDGVQPGQVAVVVDLFRSKYGPFPSSTLALTVNGQPVESSRRQIVENGQFSLKDIVFKLPGYMQGGDVLGYDLQTSSDEPLAFMATIFGVPDACQWETD